VNLAGFRARGNLREEEPAATKGRKQATMTHDDDFFRQLAGGGLAEPTPPPTPRPTAPKPPPEPRQHQGARARPGARHPLHKEASVAPPRRSVGDREPGTGRRDTSAFPPPTRWLARFVAPAGLALAALGLLLGSGDESHPTEPARTESTATEATADSGTRLDRSASPGADRGRLEVRWPASDGDALRARWRRGAKATIAGRLTTRAGKPVAGARVSVLAADAATPRHGKRTIGELRSDRRGRFRAAIALDEGAAHKLLSFSYLADPDDTVPAALGRAELRVYAPITLAAPPRRARPGGRLRLRGRSAPEATVRLLTRPPGEDAWRRLVGVRASARGRWEATVRIPAEAATGRYRLRARAAASPERGYLAAASRPVRMEVR
jgi:5-hydroxyisourate hydrolase-like protein (transthyretin family)